MSIEFTRPMNALAAGIAVATLLFAQQAAADDNGITRFAVKNCTGAKVLICAYDKTDNSLAIPYDANTIKPGDKKRSSCGSAERCKVFSMIDSDGLKKAADLAIVSGTAAFGGAAVGFVGGLVVAFSTGAASPIGIGPVIGAAIGAGSAIAIVKSLNGEKAGKICEQALKDSRKLISDIPDADLRKAARDSLKRKLSGSWPKYKSYSFVTQDGVPALVEGDKC